MTTASASAMTVTASAMACIAASRSSSLILPRLELMRVSSVPDFLCRR
jgi:hypothetical protein